MSEGARFRCLTLRIRGEPHPSLVPLQRLAVVDGFTTVAAAERFGYDAHWRTLGEGDRAAIKQVMTELS